MAPPASGPAASLASRVVAAADWDRADELFGGFSKALLDIREALRVPLNRTRCSRRSPVRSSNSTTFASYCSRCDRRLDSQRSAACEANTEHPTDDAQTRWEHENSARLFGELPSSLVCRAASELASAPPLRLAPRKQCAATPSACRVGTPSSSAGRLAGAAENAVGELCLRRISEKPAGKTARPKLRARPPR